MDLKQLSVFLPAYNEEQNIAETLDQVASALQNNKVKDYEILVINDGSKDKTAEIVTKMAKKDKHIRLVTHKVNQGYGGALKTGFAESKYDWVAFTDADGQFDFNEINKFIAKTKEADVIVGFRLQRADPFIREVLTFGWKTIARFLLGLTVKDYSCGFKLIKRKVYTTVLPLESEEKVTQIEFLVKAKRAGFKFAEVGVHHYPRRFGSPTGANFHVFMKSLQDLFRLYQTLG